MGHLKFKHESKTEYENLNTSSEIVLTTSTFRLCELHTFSTIVSLIVKNKVSKPPANATYRVLFHHHNLKLNRIVLPKKNNLHRKQLKTGSILFTKCSCICCHLPFAFCNLVKHDS